MASVSLIDPYSQKAEEIANRRRMAQALQEQGSQVLDMPTTPGVAISPYAGLAKVFQQMYGAYQDKQARKEYTDLQNEYRTNYNTQLGEMARLISAPEVKGVAGTNEIPYEPAQTEKIYGTKPAPVMGSGYGSGMLMPDQVIGEKVIKPEVPYQAAVAPVQGQPAGYISAADLQKIDIPEVKQLLMAKYLKQFEPERVTLGDNQRLLERTGGGPFRELAGVSTTPKVLEPKWEATVQKINGVDTPGWINVNAGADKAASTFVAGGKPEKIAAHWEATTQKVNGKDVPGWINLNAANKAASFVAGAKPTEAKAATPHWVEGQKDVDGKTQFGWYDLNAADKDASFKAGAKPPVGEKSNWKEVTRGNQVFYEDFNVADAAKRQAGAIAKEAVKTPPHYSEIENNGRVVIVDLSLPAKDRLANAQDKGPVRNNLEKITTTDASGREVTRYVDKTTLATLGDIPAPYKGFMSDLAEAGQLPANWQSIPQIAGLVRENLINKAGGMTQADLARLKVNIAEAASRLAYEGVPGFNPKDLTPQLPNFTTLSGGASAPAAAAALKITTRAEIAEAAKRANKSIEEVTRDAVAKGYKVQ